MMPNHPAPTATKPILLFDGQCGVCRRIARWVHASAQLPSGETSIDERPIGDDPEELRALNPNLDIWDAYATIHVLMPDGSMKLGGEAVAEVFRHLRGTKWLAQSCAFSLFGFRPFQLILNAAYIVLADVRPLFGCESCGTVSGWVKPLHWLFQALSGQRRKPTPTPHFTSLSTPARPR
jgi:predicted DCC family thiol-disulfide oxidoreductase YuxK